MKENWKNEFDFEETRKSRFRFNRPNIPDTIGKFGLFMMILFWFLVWFFAPGLLTIIYLGITLTILKSIAQAKGVDFWIVLGNNNWVFLATLAMSILSAFVAWLNPLVPQGIGGWLMSLFTSERTLVDSTFWGIVNRLFFGESFTHGWSDAVLTYSLWAIPAFAISFWDETLEFLKKLFTHLAKGEGIGKFLIKDGLAEVFWGVLRKLGGK